MAEHKHTKRARFVLNRAGYKVGGHLADKGDEAEDKKMISKAFTEHDDQLHGGKRTKLALRDGGCATGGMPPMRGDHKPRGHKGKGKGHKTVVNVVVGRGGGDKQPMPIPVPMPPPGAGMGPGGPPIPPPGPMAGPGGPPPGLLGQKHGGRPYKKGGRAKRADGGKLKEGILHGGASALKQGGRAKRADGGDGGVATHGNIRGLPDGQFKKGGKTGKKFPVPMTDGAGGGKGRLQKVRDYGAKPAR